MDLKTPDFFGEREMKLKELMSYDFTINDMNLYLDTHPNDRRAIEMFKDISIKSAMLRKNYEDAYGPLTVNTSNRMQSDKWQWIESPWPWEKM